MTVTLSRRHQARTAQARRRAAQQPKRPPIDPQMSERIAKVARQRRRRRRRIALGVLVTLLLLGGAVALVVSPIMAIDRIDVVDVAAPTGSTIDATALAEIGGVSVGEPLALLNVGDAEAELEALPVIRRATVVPTWDGRVRIAVVRRHPVAEISANGERYWLLEDGVVVDRDEPFLVPEGGERALDVAVDAQVVPGGAHREVIGESLRAVSDMSSDLRGRIRRASVDRDGTITFELRRGGIVVWGDGADVGRKSMAARAALGGQVDLDDLCVLDVRVPGQATVTRSGPACQLDGLTASTLS